MTALDNNFLVLAFYGISAASTAYSGYQIYKSYQEDGAVGALKQLGIEVAYNAAGQVVGRVGSIMYPSVRAATAAVLDEAPALKLVLGNLTDKLIIAAEKINRTVIGKAVNKVEAALLEQEAKLLGRFGIKSGAAVESELTRQEEHAIEEVVLADTGIRIKIRNAENEIAAFRQTSKVGENKKQVASTIKGTETIEPKLSREKMLPKVKTYEEARNKALELIKDVNYQKGYPHVGNLGTCENKLAGRNWEK